MVRIALAAKAAKLAQKLPDAAEIKTHGVSSLIGFLSREDGRIVAYFSRFCNLQILEMALLEGKAPVSWRISPFTSACRIGLARCSPELPRRVRQYKESSPKALCGGIFSHCRHILFQKERGEEPE